MDSVSPFPFLTWNMVAGLGIAPLNFVTGQAALAKVICARYAGFPGAAPSPLASLAVGGSKAAFLPGARRHASHRRGPCTSARSGFLRCSSRNPVFVGCTCSHPATISALSFAIPASWSCCSVPVRGATVGSRQTGHGTQTSSDRKSTWGLARLKDRRLGGRVRPGLLAARMQKLQPKRPKQSNTRPTRHPPTKMHPDSEQEGNFPAMWSPLLFIQTPSPRQIHLGARLGLAVKTPWPSGVSRSLSPPMLTPLHQFEERLQHPALKCRNLEGSIQLRIRSCPSGVIIPIERRRDWQMHNVPEESTRAPLKKKQCFRSCFTTIDL